MVGAADRVKYDTVGAHGGGLRKPCADRLVVGGERCQVTHPRFLTQTAQVLGSTITKLIREVQRELGSHPEMDILPDIGGSGGTASSTGPHDAREVRHAQLGSIDIYASRSGRGQHGGGMTGGRARRKSVFEARREEEAHLEEAIRHTDELYDARAAERLEEHATSVLRSQPVSRSEADVDAVYQWLQTSRFTAARRMLWRHGQVSGARHVVRMALV